MHTVAGVGTSATYYEDVRVPVGNLVGERNGGWALMTNQLNHERVALTSAAPLTHSIDLVRRWAQETKDADGRRVIDQEWVQVLLGRAHARADMLTLLNWKLASSVDDLSPAARLGHQGLRLRARDRGLPLADGGRRARWPRSPATPRAPCSPGGSSASTARRW